MIKKLTILTTLLVFTSASAGAELTDAQWQSISNYQSAYEGKVKSFGKTLVDGLYAFYSDDSKYMKLITQEGEHGTTIFWTPEDATSIRKKNNLFKDFDLSKQQFDALRMEMIAEIRKEDLIQVKLGDGKEEMFLYSAVDCGYCGKHEVALAKNPGAYNATIYVIPYSLSSSNWPIVQRIMCSDDPAKSWRTYWTDKVQPNNNGQCQWSRDISRLSLSFVAETIGVGGKGTPTMMLADGSLIHPTPTNPVPSFGKDYDAKNALFGSSIDVKTNYFITE